MIAAKFVDKIGYRLCIVAAHLFAAAGLASMAFLPDIAPDPFVGLLCSVCIYAIGSGLIEVLISPIVEACPTERKESAMSLLHSFYCWGTVAVVLLSTGFFTFIGIENWKLLTVLWSILPLGNAFYFSQVPIISMQEETTGFSIKDMFKMKMFWILVLLMICAGAAEQSVSQWASAFAESALGISKTVGDLLGICAFAILMGLSRALYAKFDHLFSVQKVMAMSGLLCIFSYLLISLSPFPALSLAGCAICGFSVGVLWPATFSLSAKQLKGGGTALFALLALASDLGCSGGPTYVGFISGHFNNNLSTGILFAVIFPLLLLFGLYLVQKTTKAKIPGKTVLQK